MSGEVFHQQWAARGLATCDINNDGKLDVVVTSNDGPAWVLTNQTETTNHWITLNLVGTKSNRDGIGAQVKLSTANGDQFATVTTSSSYQSSSDKRLHFGFGTADSIREIEIRWPSGIRQLIKDVRADQILKITEAEK
jgi:enediyne biosynthesis protein E4